MKPILSPIIGDVIPSSGGSSLLIASPGSLLVHPPQAWVNVMEKIDFTAGSLDLALCGIVTMENQRVVNIWSAMCSSISGTAQITLNGNPMELNSLLEFLGMLWSAANDASRTGGVLDISGGGMPVVPPDTDRFRCFFDGGPTDPFILDDMSGVYMSGSLRFAWNGGGMQWQLLDSSWTVLGYDSGASTFPWDINAGMWEAVDPAYAMVAPPEQFNETIRLLRDPLGLNWTVNHN